TAPVTTHTDADRPVRAAGAPHAGDSVSTMVGSRRVAVVAPYFATDEADDVAALFAAPQCPPYDVDFWTGADAGAERFKNLDAYGFVLMTSHGDAMFHGLGPVYRSEWRWETVEGQVVTLTGTVLGADNLTQWE